MGYEVLCEGQQGLVVNNHGQARLVIGPRRVRLVKYTSTNFPVLTRGINALSLMHDTILFFSYGLG